MNTRVEVDCECGDIINESQCAYCEECMNKLNKEIEILQTQVRQYEEIIDAYEKEKHNAY